MADDWCVGESQSEDAVVETSVRMDGDPCGVVLPHDRGSPYTVWTIKRLSGWTGIYAHTHIYTYTYTHIHIHIHITPTHSLLTYTLISRLV